METKTELKGELTLDLPFFFASMLAITTQHIVCIVFYTFYSIHLLPMSVSFGGIHPRHIKEMPTPPLAALHFPSLCLALQQSKRARHI